VHREAPTDNWHATLRQVQADNFNLNHIDRVPPGGPAANNQEAALATRFGGRYEDLVTDQFRPRAKIGAPKNSDRNDYVAPKFAQGPMSCLADSLADGALRNLTNKPGLEAYTLRAPVRKH